jgi:hypothetical protein
MPYCLTPFLRAVSFVEPEEELCVTRLPTARAQGYLNVPQKPTVEHGNLGSAVVGTAGREV